MKIISLILICTISFPVFANKDDTRSAQLIDAKGMAYEFGQAFIVGKGGTKEFTVAGLYDQFSALLVCKVSLPDVCPSSSAYDMKSAFIMKSNLNNNIDSTQIDFQCSSEAHYATINGVRVDGYSARCNQRFNNAFIFSCDSWGTTKYFQTKNIKEFQFKVTNGSSFTIINRPEFNLQFICTAD